MSLRLRAVLALYGLAWILGLPLALGYILWRARRDPGYRAHLAERFGSYRQRMRGPVWIHAVSLGELRAAAPLARAFLDRGEAVVFTHLTPAGRREAERLFAADIAAGQAATVWMPVDTGWGWAGFHRAFAPRLGLVIETERWPRMILSARRRGVPLFAANAQYPRRRFEADARHPWRQEIVAQLHGALVKSDLQAARFRAAGLAVVEVTGETRFDIAVPPALRAAGLALRDWFGGAARQVVCFASTSDGEDPVYIETLHRLFEAADRAGRDRPAVLYVPRRPERFAEVADMLAAAGLDVGRRSQVLDNALAPRPGVRPPGVLVCDSTGEMFAFLAAAECVVVGGGFTAKGVHNIIEPLALGRPVLCGPNTAPYEYPFEEARTAGIARSVHDAGALTEALANVTAQAADMERFFANHTGAVQRTLDALDRHAGR